MFIHNSLLPVSGSGLIRVAVFKSVIDAGRAALPYWDWLDPAPSSVVRRRSRNDPSAIDIKCEPDIMRVLESRCYSAFDPIGTQSDPLLEAVFQMLD